MGCLMEVNSLLKAGVAQPDLPCIQEGENYVIYKNGYRMFPIGCRIQLVNKDWQYVADIYINELRWKDNETEVHYFVDRILERPFQLAGEFR